MDRCLKFKHEVKAVVAPCKEVFKYTKKKLKKSKNTSFFTKSSVFLPPFALHLSVILIASL